jgi:hypothetical protein
VKIIHAVFVSFLLTQTPEAKEVVSVAMDQVADSVGMLAVNYEMESIAQMVHLGIVTGEEPTPQNFSNYLRENLLVRVAYSQRDTSLDFWGSPYKLSKKRGRFLITSAGPDKKFGTKDDMNTGYTKAFGRSPASQIMPLPMMQAAISEVNARRSPAELRRVYFSTKACARSKRCT